MLTFQTKPIVVDIIHFVDGELPGIDSCFHFYHFGDLYLGRFCCSLLGRSFASSVF